MAKNGSVDNYYYCLHDQYCANYRSKKAYKKPWTWCWRPHAVDDAAYQRDFMRAACRIDDSCWQRRWCMLRVRAIKKLRRWCSVQLPPACQSDVRWLGKKRPVDDDIPRQPWGPQPPLKPGSVIAPPALSSTMQYSSTIRGHTVMMMIIKSENGVCKKGKKWLFFLRSRGPPARPPILFIFVLTLVAGPDRSDHQNSVAAKGPWPPSFDDTIVKGEGASLSRL